MNLRNLIKDKQDNKQNIKTAQQKKNIKSFRWNCKNFAQHFFSVLRKIEGFAQQKNIDMICISSSSLFLKKLTKISSLLQVSEFIRIQNITDQACKKFAGKVILKYRPKISEDAKNYMIQQQYSLRKIVRTIQRLKKENTPKQRQKESTINADKSQQDLLSDLVTQRNLKQRLNDQKNNIVQKYLKKLEKDLI